MKANATEGRVSIIDEHGFSLMEMILAIGVMVIISAIAIPSFAQWVDGAEYRKTSRHVLLLLQEARSKAITDNAEYRVEFDSDNQRYRMTRGDRSSGSLNWDTVVYDWFAPPPGVNISANVENIHLNPNGTANAGTICIQDGQTHTTHYEVRIARTGRIRIPVFL